MNVEHKGMGSTIVLAWFINGKVYVGWCGDSRAYCYNPINGLQQLSHDHSYVQELVDAGKITADLAFNHPDSNIITRSLGDPNGVVRPDVKEFELHNNDIILLCSDGLCGYVRDADIEATIKEHQTSMVECRDALWNMAEKAPWGDNVTIELLQVISGAAIATKPKVSDTAKENTSKTKGLKLAIVVGKAHYVVLNDNFYIGRDYFYIGYLDERQFAWLEKDLSYVDEGSTVFVILHIPSTCEEKDRKQFSYSTIANVMTNAPQLHRMLAPYNAHILSGHTHTTYNQQITDRLYEHVIPALSGAWWQGVLCTDGTPRGYGVFEVDGDKVDWYYKSTDYAPEHQMTVYYGEQYPQFAGQVVANVWAADTKWTIEARFDGGKAQKMESFTAYDPAAQVMYADREKLDHPYVYPTPADHFYRVAIPAGARVAEVTATDRFGRVYTQTITLK